MVYSKTVRISTGSNKEIVDVTGKVAAVVAASGVKDGLALVFTRHTTTGLYINERESGLTEDVEGVLCNLVPARGSYLHDRVDNNAASHIQSILLTASVVLPVEGGNLGLGTWQSILFAERDGPRSRSITVKVVGE